MIADARARVVVVSYNDEAWVSAEELRDMCSIHGHVEVLSFESRRDVGVQIGIHNPKGERVGVVSHVRNHEYLAIAGDRSEVNAWPRRCNPGGRGPCLTTQVSRT